MDSAAWWVFEKEGERGFQAHEKRERLPLLRTSSLPLPRRLDSAKLTELIRSSKNCLVDPTNK